MILVKENHPADTRIISGLNLWADGTMTSSNTVRMAISPDPPANGKLSVAPSPFPHPMLSIFPVPGEVECFWKNRLLINETTRGPKGNDTPPTI
ncbi:hypothetical protein Hanom_Chr00s055518g01782591 [Helianthus anomalus]